jgi:LmbE family N-acetylglucosaminyl deacetylase
MNVLFLGAHTDDIEHGAGGVLSKFMPSVDLKIRYLTFSRCTDLYRNKSILEDQKSVSLYLEEHNVDYSMLDFSNRKLNNFTEEIRQCLEHERDIFDPSIIFTHWRNDIHQDHKTVFDESIRVFKNKNLLEYQCIPSCPAFSSNFFIPLLEEEIENKIFMLSLFKTQ